MARNPFHIVFGLPDPNDNSSFSRQPNESREDFRARIVEQTNAAAQAAERNAKDYQAAKEAGLVQNAAEWDAYLVASGRATDIEKTAKGYKVNGIYMSEGEYDDWCTRHGR